MPTIAEEKTQVNDRLLPNIAIFLLLLAAFSSVGYYLTINLGLRRYYMVALMWSPGLAAFATCKLRGISFSSLGWKWGESRWHWMAYLIPIFYGLVAYGILWGSGLGGAVSPKYIDRAGAFLGLSGWSDIQVLIFAIVMFGTAGMVWRIAASLGEELGWRGFLTPQLMQRFSFPVTSLIVGLIWSTWHAPLIFYTKYNAGPYDLNQQMLNFTIVTIGLSFVLTYLRLKSGSVWPATVLHAAHNTYVISIFGEMTVNYSDTRYYMGEFGVILPAVMVVFGGYFWFRARQEGIAGPTGAEEA